MPRASASRCNNRKCPRQMGRNPHSRNGRLDQSVFHYPSFQFSPVGGSHLHCDSADILMTHCNGVMALFLFAVGVELLEESD